MNWRLAVGFGLSTLDFRHWTLDYGPWTIDMKIERFEDIEAWQTARELTQQIYKATVQGQFTRDYGLRDQVQRAAVSIMANISEGPDQSRVCESGVKAR